MAKIPVRVFGRSKKLQSSALLDAQLDSQDAEPTESQVAEHELHDEVLGKSVERIEKRLERAAQKELGQRTREFLLDFLELVDDLDRAIAAARAMDHNPEVLAGIDLVRRNFLRKLAAHGVSPLPALGMSFSPHLHEAIAAVPVADPARDKQVISVVQEGYLLGEEVLRPARVRVGKWNSLARRSFTNLSR